MSTVADTRWRFVVAPMMDWTDRHCRVLHRLLSRRARLTTEMVTAAAVIRGDRERLLGFSAAEHPVALQLGGADAAMLAEAARIGEGFGYDEINLNVGCPSDRVQGGRFGACLMREPEHVGDLVAAMRAAVRVPVTVKCRLGVDEQDVEEALDAVADASLAAGADALIVHARKAWLQGLSPKENREVPPLDHARVHRLKARLGAVPVVLNGGLRSVDDALPHLVALDGVMLGRAAYQDPAVLLRVDPELFGDPAPLDDPLDALEALIPYAETQLARGARLHSLTRHALGLANGLPGARAFRRGLATRAIEPGAGVEVLREVLAQARAAAARARDTSERAAA